jgi:hypothetical protein
MSADESFGLSKPKLNKILVEKPQGKRVLRRPMYICENNIQMDLRETVCKGMD